MNPADIVVRLIALAVELVGHALVKQTVDQWALGEKAAEGVVTARLGPEPK